MRAVRRSPLFRIALLSLAVALAHTAHAANKPILPDAPPCPVKVAAAQPDSQRKPVLAKKQFVRLRFRATSHGLSGGSLFFPLAHAAALFSTHSTFQIAAAPWTVDVAPQRRPFALRI